MLNLCRVVALWLFPTLRRFNMWGNPSDREGQEEVSEATLARRVDILKHLSQIHRSQFDIHQKVEWKLILTALGFYVAAVVAVGTDKIEVSNFSFPVITGFYSLFTVVICLFLARLQRAHTLDKTAAETAEDALWRLVEIDHARVFRSNRRLKRFLGWPCRGFWFWLIQAAVIGLFAVGSCQLVLSNRIEPANQTTNVNVTKEIPIIKSVESKPDRKAELPIAILEGPGQFQLLVGILATGLTLIVVVHSLWDKFSRPKIAGSIHYLSSIMFLQLSIAILLAVRIVMSPWISNPYLDLTIVVTFLITLIFWMFVFVRDLGRHVHWGWVLFATVLSGILIGFLYLYWPGTHYPPIVRGSQTTSPKSSH